MKGYKLIDSGRFRKLEQFGDIIIDRPVPFADWPKNDESLWDNTDAYYQKSKDGGEWIINKVIPEIWQVQIDKVVFNLKLSPGGSVGIFPEQIKNWNWLKNICKDQSLRVLNGFAYTGGSTLFSALHSEGEIVHLDGAKSSVLWAKENAAASNLTDKKIRWITEDVLKFMEREIKRGNSYNGIILDPPAFGRGPDGKTWKLSKDIAQLFEYTGKLMQEDPKFLLFSCHDTLIKKETLLELAKTLPFFKQKYAEVIDLTIGSETNHKMEMGIALKIVI